ncbi:MAG: SBBP repeat-containing protein [Ignavibacteria bacterium]|nr:SBBP repeat-containing protein [Ignavibacteria bacterium]
MSNAGSSDAFVTKFSSGGNALTFSTYIGGNSDEYGIGIAVDGSGNAYITGAPRPRTSRHLAPISHPTRVVPTMRSSRNSTATAAP